MRNREEVIRNQDNTAKVELPRILSAISSPRVRRTATRIDMYYRVMYTRSNSLPIAEG